MPDDITPGGGEPANPQTDLQDAAADVATDLQGDPGGEPEAGGAPPAADPAGGEPAKPAADWPQDWREKAAKGDDKVLKRLSRYASPSAALDALMDVQAKISRGEMATRLKPNATPEELAKWRTENGIPEKPEAYDLNLENGQVIGDEDRPVVQEYLKFAHEHNMRPEEVKDTLRWYFAAREAETQQFESQREARDTEYAMQCADALRAEWGQEFRINQQLSLEALSTLPGGLGEEIADARMPDGRPLGSDPRFVRWLAQMQREMNPVATLMPHAKGDPGQALGDRIAELKSLMGDRQSEYWKGPKAKAMQDEYRKLIETQQRLKQRAA